MASLRFIVQYQGKYQLKLWISLNFKSYLISDSKLINGGKFQNLCSGVNFTLLVINRLGEKNYSQVKLINKQHNFIYIIIKLRQSCWQKCLTQELNKMAPWSHLLSHKLFTLEWKLRTTTWSVFIQTSFRLLLTYQLNKG